MAGMTDSIAAPLGHLDAYFERNRRALVGIVIEGDDDQPFYLASGVAVRLGGRVFVLTAGHNVWGRGRLQEIAMGAPTEHIVTLIRPGNGSAGQVFVPAAVAHEDPEPDVAVVEPTPKTFLPPEPFTEDEIAFFDPSRVSELTETQVAGVELVVAGFPSRMASFEKNDERQPGRATHGSLSVGINSMRVWSIPSSAGDRHRFVREPPDGRGVHVYMSLDIITDPGSSARSVDPVGMSGGPLVVPEHKGVLVGLMRSKIDFHGGWDVWFEPAAEAVRLLTDHDDRAVSAAAKRVVDRYDSALAAVRMKASKHQAP